MKTAVSEGSGVSRRGALKLMGAGAATLALGACSAGSHPSTGSGGTGGGTKKGQKVLHMTSCWNPPDPRATAQAKIIDMFEKANPDVKVDVEYVVWDQSLSSLSLKVGAGQPPDLSLQQDTDLLTLISQGDLAPLDQFTNGWTAKERADLTSPYDDLVFNGHLYALRESPRPSNALFYSKDAFSAAGVSEPPKTATEWAEVAAKCTSAGKYGLTIPLGNTSDMIRFVAAFSSMLWARGGDLYDVKSGKPIFDQEPGIFAAQWLQDLVYKSGAFPKSAVTASANEVDQQFPAGVVAMTTGNTGNLGSYQAARKGDWLASASFPNFANDGSKPGAAFVAGSWCHTIPKGGNAELAWRLIEFYQTPEADLMLAKIAGEIPARKRTLKNSFFSTPAAANTKSWLQWMEANPHPATVLKVPKYQVLVQALYNAMQSVVGQKGNVEAALKSASQYYVSKSK